MAFGGLIKNSDGFMEQRPDMKDYFLSRKKGWNFAEEGAGGDPLPGAKALEKVSQIWRSNAKTPYGYELGLRWKYGKKCNFHTFRQYLISTYGHQTASRFAPPPDQKFFTGAAVYLKAYTAMVIFGMSCIGSGGGRNGWEVYRIFEPRTIKP